MRHESEWTHNNSFGRNLVLILRALFGLIGFSALWVGIALNGREDFTYGTILTVAGGMILALTLLCNLVFPWMTRKK